MLYDKQGHWEAQQAQNLSFSNSIYEHDTIDIADPSSMQDACHI